MKERSYLKYKTSVEITPHGIGRYSCQCPYFQKRKKMCKHIAALVLEKTLTPSEKREFILKHAP